MNQQKMDQQVNQYVDVPKSCLFGISNDGLILGGVSLSWITILIVIVVILWVLNSNGNMHLPFGNQSTNNIQVPAPTSGGGFGFTKFAPSLPRGDVAKLFNHDSW